MVFLFVAIMLLLILAGDFFLRWENKRKYYPYNINKSERRETWFSH